MKGKVVQRIHSGIITIGYIYGIEKAVLEAKREIINVPKEDIKSKVLSKLDDNSKIQEKANIAYEEKASFQKEPLEEYDKTITVINKL